MSDNVEMHTPEEWVAILGYRPPVVESVNRWAAGAYESVRTTKGEFAGLYATATTRQNAATSYNLHWGKNGDKYTAWFVGGTWVEIVVTADNLLAAKGRLDDSNVRITFSNEWSWIGAGSVLSVKFLKVGETIEISRVHESRFQALTTPKIKRIVFTKGDAH